MPDSDSDIDLAELDAMSSSDEDSSDDEAPGMLGAFMEKQKKKNQLTDFDGFNEGDEGTVVEKMKTILALRASLGIDDDKSFMEEQKKKDEERKRLETMTDEERLSYEEGKAGDVMARIRAKHAEKMKAMEAKRQAQGGGAPSSLLGDADMKKKKKKDGLVGPDGKKKKKKKPVDGEDAPVRRLKKSGSMKVTGSADMTGGKKKVKKSKSSESLDDMIASLKLGEGDDAAKKKPKPRNRRASTAGRLEGEVTDVEGVKRKKKVKKKAATLEDL